MVYEMLVGRPPFRAQHHVELLIKIDKGEDRIRFPGEKESGGGGGVSEELKELCRGLLKKDPRDRMTFSKFFAHPCVQDEPPAPKQLDLQTMRRLSNASDRVTPPRSPLEESKRANATEYYSAARGAHPMQNSPSHEGTVSLATQARRVSPPHEFVGPPLQHRRVSLTSQRPPLNVDTRTSPGLQPGTSPSSRYAPELERNPSLRSNSGNLGTSNKGSPGSSHLQQRGVYRPRTPEEAPVGGTSSFEIDYVLVESRRAVEVNALADELAYSPHRRASESKPRYDALIKRGAPYPSGNTGTSPVTTANQVRNPRNVLVEQQRSVSTPVHPHVPSGQSPSPTGYIHSERRFGTSPSSTLAKAISMASMKLFGTSSPSPPYLQTHHPVERGAIIKAGSGGVEEETAVREIEEVALRSNVIYQFAEMKLSQIIPTSLTSSAGVPSSPSPIDRRRDSTKNTILTDEADAMICTEALALYIKSLSLLQKSMDLAARHWQRKGGTGVASPRLNNAVQWGRERFNETLEKADFVKSKIPPNHKELNITPEKLIYDRALEMVLQSGSTANI